MTIDIIMPTLNGEAFLAQQIESILAQSVAEWRLLIADDGSTDGTRDIIDHYHTLHGDRIVDVTGTHPLRDVSRNVEYLLDRSSAPYVMVADQDDVWDPHKISTTWDAMTKVESQHPSRPCLVHTDLQVVDADLHMIDGSLWHYQHLRPTTHLASLLFDNVVTGCTMMINRPLLHQACPFPPGIFMYDWWFALVASTFGVLQSVPATTVKYRQHSHNVIGAQRLDWWPLNGAREQSHGVRYLMNRRMERTHGQANAFLEKYGPVLDTKTKDLLLAYLNLQQQSPIKRRQTAMKYGFFRGSLKAVATMWFLL